MVPSCLLAKGIGILRSVPKGWIHATNWWVALCQGIFGGIIKIPFTEGNYMWCLGKTDIPFINIITFAIPSRERI